MARTPLTSCQTSAFAFLRVSLWGPCVGIPCRGSALAAAASIPASTSSCWLWAYFTVILMFVCRSIRLTTFKLPVAAAHGSLRCGEDRGS